MDLIWWVPPPTLNVSILTLGGKFLTRICDKFVNLGNFYLLVGFFFWPCQILIKPAISSGDTLCTLPCASGRYSDLFVNSQFPVWSAPAIISHDSFAASLWAQCFTFLIHEYVSVYMFLILQFYSSLPKILHEFCEIYTFLNHLIHFLTDIWKDN